MAPRSVRTLDPYGALGVARGAADDEIKSAYRRRARDLHPDVNHSDPDAGEKFKELAAAYELLSDPLKRSAYDRGRLQQTSWDSAPEPTAYRPWEVSRRPQPQSWTAIQTVGLYERTALRLGRRGHAPEHHCVLISPDLRRVATHRGETVQLWDAATGRRVAGTGGGDQGIRCLGFSPDGRFLITESHRGTVLWDALHGREVDRLNLAGPAHLSFSSDGRLMATTAQTLALVSSAADGRELAQIPHGEAVESISLSDDGARLATAAGHEAHVWDVRSGRELATFVHRKPPVTVKLSTDGRLLATDTTRPRSAWGPSTVQIWDVESGEAVTELEHTCWVDRIVFAPGGQRLATDSNGTLRLWDLGNGDEIARMQFVTTELVFGPNGDWLAGAFDSHLYIWDTDSGYQVACLTHVGSVQSLGVDPDGRRIGTASLARTGQPPGLAPISAHVWLRE